MNNLPEDTLNIISSFLHNLSCCRKSDFHNFSLINKFFYNMYKEKLVIVPPIHNHIILSIYKKNMIHQLKNSNIYCPNCGPFNSNEINMLHIAIQDAYDSTSDASELPKCYWPQSPQSHIHLSCPILFSILRNKVSSLNGFLTFLIEGSCCSGKGAKLYIKH